MQGVQLPTGYYLGASATTGDLSDNHDIISVRLFELDLPDDVSFSHNYLFKSYRKFLCFQPRSKEDRSHILPSATYFEPPRDHVEDPKPSSLSGIKIFLLMLFGSIVLVACVVIGIMFYQKQNERSRKRFY